MTDWTYSPDRSFPAKIKRRLTQWNRAAPVHIPSDRFVVSFTFDDFPKSALKGADIVESFGGKAGFFACTSMIGENGPYGEMFDTAALEELQSRGHEVGAHTHSHLDCAQTPTQKVLGDVEMNLMRLRELGLQDEPTSFAFPFGETSFITKSKLAEKFALCRGVLPGINVGNADLAQLRSFELDGDANSALRARTAIEKASKTGGWVIIFTHDVSNEPTGYGTSPDILTELCQRAKDAGAEILSPTQAARELGLAA